MILRSLRSKFKQRVLNNTKTVSFCIAKRINRNTSRFDQHCMSSPHWLSTVNADDNIINASVRNLNPYKSHLVDRWSIAFRPSRLSGGRNAISTTRSICANGVYFHLPKHTPLGGSQCHPQLNAGAG